jgi:hypothetical protein
MGSRPGPIGSCVRAWLAALMLVACERLRIEWLLLAPVGDGCASERRLVAFRVVNP